MGDSEQMLIHQVGRSDSIQGCSRKPFEAKGENKSGVDLGFETQRPLGIERM